MRNKKPILLALFLMSSLFSTQSFAQKKIAKVDPRAGWHKQYTDEHKGISIAIYERTRHKAKERSGDRNS